MIRVTIEIILFLFSLSFTSLILFYLFPWNWCVNFKWITLNCVTIETWISLFFLHTIDFWEEKKRNTDVEIKRGREISSKRIENERRKKMRIQRSKSRKRKSIISCPLIRSRKLILASQEEEKCTKKKWRKNAEKRQNRRRRRRRRRNT